MLNDIIHEIRNLRAFVGSRFNSIDARVGQLEEDMAYVWRQFHPSKIHFDLYFIQKLCIYLMYFHIDIIIGYVSTLIDCNDFFHYYHCFLFHIRLYHISLLSYPVKFLLTFFFQKITHVIDYSSYVIDYIIPRTLQHMQ